MNDERMLTDLELRLTRSLEEHAPLPDPGMASRLLRRTADTAQRRGWSVVAFSGFGTALVATAVVVVAIAVGFAFSMLPRNVGDPGPSPTPSAPTTTPSLVETPSPSPSPSPTARADAGRCANEADGYSVVVPEGWWHNELVEGGELDDVAPCRFFAREPTEIRPASQASGVAIAISTQSSTGPLDDAEPTTVDGRDAWIVETLSARDDPFQPAGTRSYSYWIELDDGWLLASTSDGPNWTGDFEENVAVLDEMIESLRFTR